MAREYSNLFSKSTPTYHKMVKKQKETIPGTSTVRLSRYHGLLGCILSRCNSWFKKLPDSMWQYLTTTRSLIFRSLIKMIIMSCSMRRWTSNIFTKSNNFHHVLDQPSQMDNPSNLPCCISTFQLRTILSFTVPQIWMTQAYSEAQLLEIAMIGIMDIIIIGIKSIKIIRFRQLKSRMLPLLLKIHCPIGCQLMHIIKLLT